MNQIARVVLVTNCNTRIGFAVAKSLIKAGYRVVAAAPRLPTMLRGSKGIAGEIAYDDPFVNEADCVQAIAAAIRKYDVNVLFPVHEEIFVIAKHREAFAPAHVVAPALEPLMLAQDKLHVARLATQLGVEAPATLAVRDQASLAQAAASIGFPLVVKPRFGSGANQVRVLRRPEDLAEPSFLTPGKAYLAQQYVPGKGVGIGVFGWNNRVLAISGHKRIREIPVAGGTSTARMTYSHARLEAAAARLFSALHLDGVAMVEFRHDEATDESWLLEVNPRYWGGVPTAISSGVDFPALHLRAFLGESLAPELTVPVKQVEGRWILGELRAGFELIKARRWREALCILRREGRRAIAFDDLDEGSLRPLWHEVRQYAASFRKHGNFGGHSPEKESFFASNLAWTDREYI